MAGDLEQLPEHERILLSRVPVRFTLAEIALGEMAEADGDVPPGSAPPMHIVFPGRAADGESPGPMGSLAEVEFLMLAGESKRLQEAVLAKREPFLTGTSPEGFAKNAFLDIVPYDGNVAGPADGRYLNGSRIRDYAGRVGYIATQGPRLDPTSPKKNTAGDFWDMVVDRGAKVVLMLCQPHEVTVDKASGVYYGTPGQITRVGGWPINGVTGPAAHVKVPVEDCGPWVDVRASAPEQIAPGFTRATISIRRAPRPDAKASEEFPGAERTQWSVTQYVYSAWRDYDTPNTVSAFMNVLGEVDGKLTELDEAALADGSSDGSGGFYPPGGPLVTHCRAGIGRTGTFMATRDILCDVRHKIKSGVSPSDIEINVSGVVERMRKDRAFLVQLPTQLRFVYNALEKVLRPFATAAPK